MKNHISSVHGKHAKYREAIPGGGLDRFLAKGRVAATVPVSQYGASSSPTFAQAQESEDQADLQELPHATSTDSTIRPTCIHTKTSADDDDNAPEHQPSSPQSRSPRTLSLHANNEVRT